MEGDGETLLLNLQEAGSGPGGATAGNVDSGKLLLLARCFSADLRSIFERVAVQLAVPMARTGLDLDLVQPVSGGSIISPRGEVGGG